MQYDPEVIKVRYAPWIIKAISSHAGPSRHVKLTVVYDWQCLKVGINNLSYISPHRQVVFFSGPSFQEEGNCFASSCQYKLSWKRGLGG